MSLSGSVKLLWKAVRYGPDQQVLSSASETKRSQNVFELESTLPWYLITVLEERASTGVLMYFCLVRVQRRIIRIWRCNCMCLRFRTLAC